ncbi:MAG: hypothetical protein P4L99_00640 [Chthoniobacter sp.]|nr:hypothetical protein [Chthoniobacter sp.]
MATLVCTLLFSPIRIGVAEDLITTTDGFRVEFSTSFYLDSCGDDALGQEYRNLIYARVAECPFTESAKHQFQDYAAKATERAEAQLSDYRTKHSAAPSSVMGGHLLCSEFLHSHNIEILRLFVDSYKSGRTSLSDLFHSDCRAGSDFLSKQSQKHFER